MNFDRVSKDLLYKVYDPSYDLVYEQIVYIVKTNDGSLHPVCLDKDQKLVLVEAITEEHITRYELDKLDEMPLLKVKKHNFKGVIGNQEYRSFIYNIKELEVIGQIYIDPKFEKEIR